MSSKSFSTITISSSRHTQIIDITRDVAAIARQSKVPEGVCCVYVPHTTAAVTINENADPDVKSDILMGIESMVPSDLRYNHAEGNSPAHIKASIVGSSANIFIDNGQLVLGTWQGIYFCEFDGPRTRAAYVKIIAG